MLKTCIRWSLIVLVGCLAGVGALMLLKTTIYPRVNDHYEPSIAVNEAENLSDVDTVNKLLTLYLDHYKQKPLFDDQRIKDYNHIGVSKLEYTGKGGEEAFLVHYRVCQHVWNDYWELGLQEREGMFEQCHFVLLIKENGQFRLKILGLEPPVQPSKNERDQTTDKPSQ